MTITMLSKIWQAFFAPVQMAQDPWGKKDDKHEDKQPPDLDEFFKKIIHPKGGKNSDKEPLSFKLDKKVVVIIIVAAIAGWLSTGFYTLEKGEKGVVSFLGKYQKTTTSHLNWHAPYPLASVAKIDTSSRYSIHIGEGQSAEQLTADNNLVNLPVTLEFKVSDPRRYLSSTSEPRLMLEELLAAVSRNIVGTHSFSQLTALSDEQIASDIKTGLAAQIKDLALGISVEDVKVSSLKVPNVLDSAFAAQQKANGEAKDIIARANNAASHVIPEAKAKADSIVKQAEFDAIQKLARAKTEAKRFETLLAAYQVDPEVMRAKMYFDTMQQVLENNRNVIINGADAAPVVNFTAPATSSEGKKVEQAVTPTAPTEESAKETVNHDLRSRSETDLRSR